MGGRSSSGAAFDPESQAPGIVYLLQLSVMQTAIDCVFYDEHPFALNTSGRGRDERKLTSSLSTGMQAALTFAAWGALARREGRSILIKVAVAALFCISTLAVALALANTIGGLDPNFTEATSERYNIALSAIVRISYLLSDVIVVWRAWVLSPDSRVAKAALLLCVCGSTVGVTYDFVWAVQNPAMVLPAARTLIKTIPLLLTNVVATIVVGLRVWRYRRDIKFNLDPLGRKTRAEKILVLLVESGFLYSLIWVFGLVVQYYGGEEAFFALYSIVGRAYHSISGIYPTIIIIAVAMHRSENSLFTHRDPAPGQSLRFQRTGGDASTRPYDSEMTPYDTGTTPYDTETTPFDTATTPCDSATSPYNSTASPCNSTTAPHDSASEIPSRAPTSSSGLPLDTDYTVDPANKVELDSLCEQQRQSHLETVPKSERVAEIPRNI